MIDTGIDADHPDLQTLGNGYAVETCKGGGCQTPWDDDNGHGTHVAGTIGARDNGIGVIGVAPQATLHAVKVLAKNGMGSRSGVIAGIDWVASQLGSKPVVANMSLGGSGSKRAGSSCTGTGYSYTGTSSPDVLALEHAHHHGRRWTSRDETKNRGGSAKHGLLGATTSAHSSNCPVSA